MPSNNKNEHDRVDQGRLEQEAVAWILKLTSGDATEADRDAFLRWRARGPEYEGAALDAMRVWQHVGTAAAISRRRSRIPSRRLVLQGGAVAASVAGLAFAGSKLGFLPTIQDAFADYRTLAGEQRRLTFPHITVELNTRSGLSLETAKGEGHLRLVSGEAAFTARSRAGPILSLSARQAVVTASNAVFVVRLDENRTVVSCLEGSLDLLMPETGQIKAGQQALCENGHVATKAIADMEAVSGWRKGQLLFRDEPLAKVADELNRYKKGLVVVVDKAAAQRRVTGVFHLSRIDEALDHIGNALGLPVRHLSPFFTLIG
ncbi:FecR family protein [Pseudorhodoplanes sinuspersici]|nr:FecR family protein [Pseudorhodoplanes sinuspersici]